MLPSLLPESNYYVVFTKANSPSDPYAHEINNPLAAITNVLYLLKQDSPQSTKTSAYFKTVDEELERISGSVKQTLRWGSENGDEKSWIAAGSLFEDVLRLFATKIRNRAVRTAIEGDATVQVFGVTNQIRQVIAHLVSNALDAVPVGGKVWLKAERSGNLLELQVGDNGVGMNAAEQSFLFQPFYSTKGDLGNGLGLYIAKEIAERHQGSVIIESAAGHGTVIRLQLPIPG
jgi:signal transduction histidine kinase